MTSIRHLLLAKEAEPAHELVPMHDCVTFTPFRDAADQHRTPADAFLKLLRDLVPDNIVAAATDMNLLGIIFFSVCFGTALSLLQNDAGCRQIMHSMAAFNRIIIKMVRYATFGGPSAQNIVLAKV